jgi:nitroreductase
MSPSPPQFESLYDLIRHRRSIRQYKPDPVPEEVLDRILEAGFWAPSGKNIQNWRFFVLQGDKRDAYLQYSQQSWDFIRPLLEKRLKPSLYAFTERFFYTLGGAPVVIMAYNKPNPEENNQTSLGSVYMAVQNMLLAAEYEGLGTCAMGSPLEVKDEVDAFLGVTDTDLELVCGIALGYPDHTPPSPPRQPGRVCWMT